MIDKIYETLTFLFLVDIGLFALSVLVMMAEQEWVDKLWKFILGLAVLLAVAFVITFIVGIWI